MELSRLLQEIAVYVKGWMRSAGENDGWLLVPHTLTYASSTTLTGPTGKDITWMFPVGTPMKIDDNGSWDYYYVQSAVAGTDGTTTITVNGGSDYSLSGGTVGVCYVGHGVRLTGFPWWFNWTATAGGFSSAPTDVMARFIVNGRKLSFVWGAQSQGTSNATYFTLAAPMPAANLTTGDWTDLCRVRDNGAWQADPGLWSIVPGGTTITLYKTALGGAWTNSGGKNARIIGSYEI